MAKVLKRQYKLFIASYCVHFNATRAAKAAGYSERSAHSIGHDLLRIPEIKNEVNRICAEQDEAILATKTFVVDKIKAVLDADIVKYVAMGVDGATQDQLNEMPEEIRKMVTQIERTDFYDKDEDNIPYVSHSKYKFKIICKTKMVELLSKHTGAVTTTVIENNNNINQLSYGELLEQAEAAEKKKAGKSGG